MSKPRLITSPHSSLSLCSSLCFLSWLSVTETSGHPECSFASLPHPQPCLIPHRVTLRSNQCFPWFPSPLLSFSMVLHPSSDAPLFSGQFQQLSDCLLPLLNNIVLLHCCLSCLSKPQTSFPHENVLEQLIVRQSTLPLRHLALQSWPCLCLHLIYRHCLLYPPCCCHTRR